MPQQHAALRGDTSVQVHRGQGQPPVQAPSAVKQPSPSTWRRTRSSRRLQETYYVDKGVRQSFRGWRDYYKNLERLQDNVYTKGTRLHLEKAWMFFGSHVEDPCSGRWS